jgi:TRAP-type C4-dicarboxylate transport system substrate-binding protein
VARTYALDEHTAVPDVLLIATEVWDSLTLEHQGFLATAVQESAEIQKKLWREAEAEALRVVEEAGVEIYRPEKAPFQARVARLQEEYRSDPELRPWIDRVVDLSSVDRAAAPETR